MLSAPLCAVSAHAQIVETSTILNTLRYTVGSHDEVIVPDVGPSASFSIADYSGGFASEMQLDLTGTLDDKGNFFFLHNGVCVGYCQINITTEILFTVTNSGAEPVDVRFDSLITPGHLARSNFVSPGDSGGFYAFEVRQDPGTADNVLYLSTGSVGSDQILIDFSGDPSFNGLFLQDNPPDFTVLDWSGTNLNLSLSTLAPGQTTVVRYFSQLVIGTLTSQCEDPSSCMGFQIAFGDPRNSGGVTDLQAPSLLGSGRLLLDGPSSPAVGAPYGVYQSHYQFVPADTPIPDEPDPIGPITYDAPYIPFGAPPVPEPGSWLLMIMGGALTGGLLRRRTNAAARNCGNAIV